MDVTNKMLTFLRKFLHEYLKIGLLYTCSTLSLKTDSNKSLLIFFVQERLKMECLDCI